MSLVIRLHRAATEVHGRDLFICSVSEWQFLLELARTFGWQAHGATYELPAKTKLTSAARRNYEPGAAADAKIVSTEDALEWAHALERAQGSAHLDSLVRAQPRGMIGKGTDTDSVGNWLAEFIEYAYGGAFTFALEPAADEDEAASTDV